MKIIETAHAGVITSAPSISEVGNNALFFLLAVFAVIGIIMSAIYGMMYFLSFGDEKQMRYAKKAAKFGVVGVVGGLSGMVLIKFLGQFF